jgi:hypothetical protein
MEFHIGYIRSLEDSDRVRAACLKFCWNLAKQAGLVLPAAKLALVRSWDRVMFRMERRTT